MSVPATETPNEAHVTPFPSPATRNARRFLEGLRTEIAHHPAVNHLFLNRLATAPFSRQDYRIFAENHFPLVCVFTHYLEVLLLRSPDSDAKLWLAKVLVDEYGEGSEGHDHAEMYGRFLDATGGDHTARMDLRVPAAALRFIRTHQRIVTEEPFLVGLGAVGPGHEWSIPEMFHAVIPGLRRAGFEEHEIDYFTLHTAQDVDHGSWLEEALASYATSSEAQDQIRAGALRSLDARNAFWDGVQRAVVTYRQPRSPRQDAVSPRGVGREVGLTAWDALSWGRWLEDRARGIRNALRPRLGDLVASNRGLPAPWPVRRVRSFLEGTP
jgi:pyrroloquinoline quinone (PQQ) biosynthesis protein C